MEQTKNDYRIVICTANELKPGQRKLVEIDGVQLAVLNAGGEYFAFRNRCPHQGAPMVYGCIRGTMIPSEPQDYKYGFNNEIIRCPHHGWEFNIRSGKSLAIPKIRLKRYEIEEVNGEILLHTFQKPQNVVITDVVLNCAL